LAFTCLTSLVAAGIAAFSIGSAHADDVQQTNDNRYSLTAEGDGMYYEITDQSLPATTTVAFSPYSSQADTNSQGASNAFAGLPYLGKFAETLPGTVNGLAGGNFPPLPPFPGYVATSYPGKKEAKQSQGPYLVSASSSQYASHATAGSGVSPNAGQTNQQVFSTAAVIANADGTVSAKATAGVDAVSVGPVDILNFSSSETITSDGKGEPKVVSQTNLGTIQVLGFKLGIDQDGFTVLGAKLPLPTKTILDNINTVLGGQGLEISVIPGDKKVDRGSGATTVTSGGLRITSVRDVPTQGPVTVVYTFGRATVSAANFASPPVTDPGSGTGTGTGTGTDTGTGTGTATTPDTPLTPPVVGTGPLPTTDVPGPSVAAPGTDGGTATPTHPRTLGFLPAGAPMGTDTWALYLVLVLAGAGVLGGQQLFRLIGVRLLLRET
jgi:hypothetical protein